MTDLLNELATLSMRTQNFVDAQLYGTRAKVSPRIEFVCDDLNDFFSLHSQFQLAFMNHQHTMGVHPASALQHQAISGDTIEMMVCGIAVRLTCTQKIATRTHGDLGAVEALNMPFVTYRAIMDHSSVEQSGSSAGS